LPAAVKPTDEGCHGNEIHPTLRYIYLQQKKNHYEQKVITQLGTTELMQLGQN